MPWQPSPRPGWSMVGRLSITEKVSIMFRFLSRKRTGGNRGSHPVLKKTQQRNTRLRLSLEELERRDCPSVFYDFNIVAQTGGSITSIQPAASINDSGDVAFVASTSAGQSVYV